MPNYHRNLYVGNPIKTIAHADCDGCNCGCGSDTCHVFKDVCEAVVDDSNGLVYIYGNIKHEDHHIPSQSHVPYTAVLSAGFPHVGVEKMDEIFVGIQEDDNITLAGTPLEHTLMVFLNGLKLVEGQERDFQMLAPNKIHFNLHSLIDTDRVEIIYSCEPVGRG